MNIPEIYQKLFDAHHIVKKYASPRNNAYDLRNNAYDVRQEYLNSDYTVNAQTRLKIAIAGDEEAEAAVKFIDEFEKIRRKEFV